jgi:hypothetical protein
MYYPLSIVSISYNYNSVKSDKICKETANYVTFRRVGEIGNYFFESSLW